MIRYKGQEITLVSLGSKSIAMIVYARVAVWEAIRSCFGRGWTDNKGWVDSEGWQ